MGYIVYCRRKKSTFSLQAFDHQDPVSLYLCLCHLAHYDKASTTSVRVPESPFYVTASFPKLSRGLAGISRSRSLAPRFRALGTVVSPDTYDTRLARVRVGLVMG